MSAVITVENYLSEYLPKLFPDYITNLSNHKDCDKIANILTPYFPYHPNYFSEAIHNFCPIVSKSNPSHIAIYRDQTNRMRDTADGEGLRTSMKPGRAIAHMFPFLSQERIQEIALKLREVLERESKPAECHVSNTREAFREMYAGAYIPARERYAPPIFTNGQRLASKHLDCSCMRYSFEGNPCHPAEVYASGDFLAFWSTEGGKISARVVVGVTNDFYVPGPIYTQCSKVSQDLVDFIESHAKAAGKRINTNAEWHGLRLLKIWGNCSFVGPYIDSEDSRNITECEDYLRIDELGNLLAENTNGFLSGSCQVTCECCGEGFEDGDGYTDHAGNPVCEECRDSYYIVCEGTGELYHDSEVVFVQSRRGIDAYFNRNYAVTVAIETHIGEWWRRDETVITADGNIISLEEYEDDYFTCDMSSEVYHTDEIADTRAIPELQDKTVSIDWMQERPLLYTETTSGVFIPANRESE